LGQVPGQVCSVFLFGICFDYAGTQPGVYDPPGWDPMLYINTDGAVASDGIVTPAAYNDNRWHRAVITYSSYLTDTLYVDGQIAGTADLNAASNFVDNWIGYSPSYASRVQQVRPCHLSVIQKAALRPRTRTTQTETVHL
jgi:hypothetical protein